jgi:ferric-dicitrate binding protein FerR (iron transport regulator)
MFFWTASNHTVRRFRCGVFFSCFSLIALLGSCSRFETRQVLATVLALEGSATVVHQGSAAPVARLSLLAVGDHLRTEPGGKATISLVPGARIVLNEDSELQVEQLQIHKLGGSVSHAVRARNARIRVLRGSICASVVHRSVQPHIRLYVATPAGTFEASPGSIFYLRVTETATHVACAGGTVTLIENAAHNAETLEADYVREWEKEKAAGLPMQAVRDANSREEVQKALAAGRESQELERSRRNLIPGLPES